MAEGDSLHVDPVTGRSVRMTHSNFQKAMIDLAKEKEKNEKLQSKLDKANAKLAEKQAKDMTKKGPKKQPHTEQGPRSNAAMQEPRRKSNSSSVLDKRHCCTICQRRYVNKCHLVRHMKDHLDTKEFECDVCGKQFSRNDMFKRHVESTHEDIERFTCTVCDKEFYHKHHLISHLKVHTDDKPYGCDICAQAFAWKCNFMRHTCSERHANQQDNFQQEMGEDI